MDWSGREIPLILTDILLLFLFLDTMLLSLSKFMIGWQYVRQVTGLRKSCFGG